METPEINWHIFKSKFPGRERLMFERLSYQLFCDEYDKTIGIFRFKNQTGIETEPIRVENEWIGFQAKYLEVSVSDAKDDIIDSIQKAKKKNPDLSKILLYVNHEFAESPNGEVKYPKYTRDIQTVATTLGVILEWRVPSHFERQLSLPKNLHLRRYFFSMGKGVVEFLNEMELHTQNILTPIHSEMSFGPHRIKIDRSAVVDRLQASIGASQVSLVYGEGGSGKTALVKDLYERIKSETPVYVFKATEFRVASENEFFSRFGGFAFQDFLEAHQTQSSKLFVVDSAERLSEIEDIETFKVLLAGLINGGWTIVFATRLNYLDDLRFQLISIYRVKHVEIFIGTLDAPKLQELSVQYNFLMPSDLRLIELLRNPFYLSQYLTFYTAFNQHIDLRRFKDILWMAKVRQSVHKNNLHIRREETFMSLVKVKADEGLFYLKTDASQMEALAKLAEDEIVKNDPAGGYFISHDVYEEWALEKIIEREFINKPDFHSFFFRIGKSLSIRRAFRKWLSELIVEDISRVRQLIEYATTNQKVEPFWRDEVFISVLLSPDAGRFINDMSTGLVKDPMLLQRVIFLLRTACKEMDVSYYRLLPQQSGVAYVVTRPKGSGWSALISFLYRHQTTLPIEIYNYAIPLLNEWVSKNPREEATRQAGLFVLDVYDPDNLKSARRRRFSEDEESIILQAAMEIPEELKSIFKQVVEGGWRKADNKYFSLGEAVLTRTYTNMLSIYAVPQSIIEVADFFWYYTPEPKQEDDPYGFRSEGYGAEEHYSIRSASHHDYFPASALQTPTLWLLRAAPKDTFDFIISFVNRTVSNYAQSSMANRMDQIRSITLHLPDGTTVTQFASISLWNMYRGTGSPVTPYLLQSIHMALEKYLLEAAKKDIKAVELWLLYLLKNSKSASTTAVVTSIVLAFPAELFNVALVLFSSSDTYFFENMRWSEEFKARSLYSIGRGLNYSHKEFEDERIATCDDSHRKNSLEWQIVLYQKFRTSDVTEEEVSKQQEAIWKILDRFYSELPQEEEQSDADLIKRLLLSRIDGRKLKPKVEDVEQGLKISFEPEVDEKLKEHAEESTKQSEQFFRYSGLRLWGSHKFENSEKAKNYPQYENDPLLVLKETRIILENIKVSGESALISDYSTPGFTCAALIKSYATQLSKEDLDFCCEVIMQYASRPLQYDYDYQISDGVEAAVSALPSVLNLYPKEKDVKLLLLLIMFDTTNIGEYKRVGDYAIEAIIGDLRRISPSDAQSLFIGYLQIKPDFDKYLQKHLPKGQRYHSGNSRIEAMEKFVAARKNELEAIVNNQVVFEIPISISADDAMTAFKLIPADTTDKDHIDFIAAALPELTSIILTNSREQDYRQCYRFMELFAYFVLSRNSADIGTFIKPWLSKLPGSDNFQYFVSQFVSAEDKMFSYEKFWIVWDELYPTMVNYAVNKPDHRVREVLPNYLLAWPYWRKGIQEWRSLTDQQKPFFEKVIKDMKSHPSTLYSIAKLLNEIGAGFAIDGVTWISNILSDNPNLGEEQLEINTQYYLEIFVKKFTYVNRTRIRTDLSLRAKVISILNFLIDGGSVQAYLLREEII